jgi:hypothetical protein
MEPLPTNKTHSELSPVGATGKTPQHKKSHPSASCIAKFPNFTASKSFAKTNLKIKKYEKNQTISVSHDYLFNRIVQHTKT